MHSQLDRRLLLRQPFSKPQPTLFLDRDGVVIEDKHHLQNPEEVELCPGVPKLLGHAKQSGWPVVLITNQSGIARGFFSWKDYEAVTQRLLELLGDASPLTAIYANGHGPDAAPNSWRKPSPGMLLAAAEELNLDLSRSILAGDRLSDLQAGEKAGLRYAAHVSTGHGKHERDRVLAWHHQAHDTAGEADHLELALLESLHDFPLERLSPLA
jgi:D-glycero-D-manno-heptose 1,7-bisphosphate phosphatase